MRWVLAAAILVVLCGLARADGDPRAATGYIGKELPRIEIDDCPPVPPMSPDQLRRIGSEHYQRGEVLYVQGDYTGAVTELVAAYCLIPQERLINYTMLKDIGQAYERKLDYERAIAYLERYVMAVPTDARAPSPCAPDPQADKQNVLARIAVLSNLKAQILINTEPGDAAITLSNDAGVAGRARSGQQIEVVGGRYDVLVEREGYVPVHREIRADIGKPYTYFEKLEPRKGRLRLRVTPADARLFLDKRQVGTGTYEAELPGGHYTVVAEAEDRVTVTRELEVLPDRDTPISFELPPQPEFGRRQLMIYAGLAGGIAGGALAGASDSGTLILSGIGAGIAGGLIATYYGTPRRLALGTSSLTITSSLIGGVTGGAVAPFLSSSGNVQAPLIGGGLVLGAGIGYYAGEVLHTSPGDAAVVNSGALWGTVAGSLFTQSFAGAGPSVESGLTLSGLAMGTLGGVLLTRYFTISRGHAALIDVGGVVGLFVGVAADSLVTQASNDKTSSNERKSNYALGGIAAGLIGAGILTRSMDEPSVPIAPIVTKAQTANGGSTAIFGVGATF